MADHTLTLNLVLPALILDGDLDYQGPLSTDLSNDFDGMQFGGWAILEETPPVVTGSYPLPQNVDKASAFPEPDLDDHGRPVPDTGVTFTNPKVLSRASHVDRILVGGKDITWFRASGPGDGPTLLPGYTLIEPFGYGASETLVIPRTNSLFEMYGTGALHWLHQGARVLYQRVYDPGGEDERVVTDYRGVVLAVGTSGGDDPNFQVSIGGEVSARTGLAYKPPVKQRKVFDLGAMMYFACKTFGIRLVPDGGPTTGLLAVSEGGLDYDSWMTKIGAWSKTGTDPQRVLMPFGTWGGTRWSFSPKNTEDVDVTVWVDGAKAAARLVDDLSEQHTGVFGNGVSPNGERWDGSKYFGIVQGPPPAYPFDDNRTFGSGTTDADTDSGFGITALRRKLLWDRLLADSFFEGDDYDSHVTAAVERLQEAAGLTVTGNMTPAAWNALWDTDAVGFHIDGARVFPLAQSPSVEHYLYSAGGDVIGLNPNHVPGSVRVDVAYDYDVCEEATARAHAHRDIRLSSGHQWAGFVTLTQWHAFAGDLDDTDIASLGADDIMSARDIRPGMNLKLPHFDGTGGTGGTVLHIAQARVSPGPTGDTVEFAVDTGYRDVYDLAAALKRSRESRRSPYREFIAANRGWKPPGNLITRDPYFGKVYQDVRLRGGRWNLVPFIMGQQGTVGRTDIKLSNVKTEHCGAVFVHKVDPTRLGRLVGNPFSVDDNGQTAWERESNNHLFEDRVLLYLYGQGAQPGGYGWKKGYYSDGTRTPNPLTGEHIDDASWPYVTAPSTAPLAYLLIYPRSSCTLKRGRLFYALEDDVT